MSVALLAPRFEDFRARSRLPLGFGTAGLLQNRSAKEAERIIAQAYDAGLRYFDTARSYGYGQAERALARGLRGVRHETVIVTKAGILPPSAYDRGRAKLTRLLSGRTREAHARKGAFALAELRTSVETSLRELETDYLDALLLHDCAASELNDEIARLCEDLVREGKIRAFGIATEVIDAARIAVEHPWATSIVQGPALSGLVGGAVTHLVVTHSALRLGLNGAPAATRAARAEQLLQSALDDNPNGIVLFSSSRRCSMDSNVRIAQRQR